MKIKIASSDSEYSPSARESQDKIITFGHDSVFTLDSDHSNMEDKESTSRRVEL